MSFQPESWCAAQKQHAEHIELQLLEAVRGIHTWRKRERAARIQWCMCSVATGPERVHLNSSSSPFKGAERSTFTQAYSPKVTKSPVSHKTTAVKLYRKKSIYLSLNYVIATTSHQHINTWLLCLSCERWAVGGKVVMPLKSQSKFKPASSRLLPVTYKVLHIQYMHAQSGSDED